MATCTMYKIIFNGVLLPDIYFTYSEADAACQAMKENSCAGFGRVVTYDDMTNTIGN